MTDTCLLIDYQDVGVFKDKKKLYWKGTYADLAEQDLKIVVSIYPHVMPQLSHAAGCTPASLLPELWL